MLVTEVIYGILVNTPNSRISEELVKQGILIFAKKSSLLDNVEVSQEAIDDWAAKQAFATKHLIMRFKKIWGEAPNHAEITSLKKRLNKSLMERGTELDSTSCSPASDPSPASTTTSFLEGSHAFDWSLLEKNLQEAADAVSKSSPSSSPTTKCPSPTSSTPTSANSKVSSASLQLPDWVLLLIAHYSS